MRIVPPEDNANGARAKSKAIAGVLVSAPTVRLYSEYMHTEYGDLDSDYVFVNLFAAPVGRPRRYDAVAKLVARLRAGTGIEFSRHVLGHTRATSMRAGVPIKIVSKMLTHRSVVTTSENVRPSGCRGRPGRARPGWGLAASAGPVVTAELRAARTDGLSLLDKLQAAVRQGFAVELIHTDPAHPVFARGQCRVTGCERGAWSKFLCSGHYGRWTHDGRPHLDLFAMMTGPVVGGSSDRIDAFDLRGMPLQLRLVLAYSIQQRHDQRTIRLIPTMINRLVELVTKAQVDSLLDHGLDRWTLLAHQHGVIDTGGRAIGRLRFEGSFR